MKPVRHSYSELARNSYRLLLQIADMNREGDSSLGEEYYHLDGHHKRCSGCKTITLWMYHAYVRQMCKIARMKIEAENAASMNIFWGILNEAIQDQWKAKCKVSTPRLYDTKQEDFGHPLPMYTERRIFKDLSAVKIISILL